MTGPGSGRAPDGGLNVLHATKRYVGTPGGDAAVVSTLEQWQRRQGYCLHVLVPRCSEIEDLPHVVRFGLPIANSALDRIAAGRIASLGMLRMSAGALLARFRPDVVHAHSVDLAYALAPALRRLAIPLVVTLHGSSLADDRLPAPKRWLEARLLERAHPRAVVTADPLAVPRLRELALAGPVRYLPNGVDPARFRPAPARADRLLYVGRLEQLKGVDVLLSAFAALLRHRPGAVLDVVGDGPERAALQRQAGELGLGSSVRFHGAVPPEDVPDVYAAGGVFVLPSRHEGFPVAVLEACCSGLPVVATSVGALASTFERGTAVLVPPRAPDALAAALERLLADPAEQARLAAAARELVHARFTSERLASAVDDVYREVLAR